MIVGGATGTDGTGRSAASRVGRRGTRAVGVVLALSAAPTFAIAAVVSGLQDGRSPMSICMSSHGPGWLAGMTPMYALMSVFHASPWLKMNERWRRRRRSVR